VEVNKKVGAT